MNKEESGRISHVRRLFPFATVGAFCTVLSLLLNFIFLKYFNTRLIPTYVVVYATTILISFLLNSHFTFGAQITAINVVTYFGIYLSSMGLGVLLLLIYRSMFTFENWVYPFMSVPFTMLWNYAWSSRLLKRKVR